MKFNLTKTSNSYGKNHGEITLKNFKELIKFIDKEGRIIIEPSWSVNDIKGHDYTIEVYDDYRE